MPDRRPALTRRRLVVVLANAVALVALYGSVVIGGARSNVQGAIEMAAFGTLILFWLAILTQLGVLVWLEGRRR